MGVVTLFLVMPGLDPGIHDSDSAAAGRVDPRVRPEGDDKRDLPSKTCEEAW
jgi:hypothetical protein